MRGPSGEATRLTRVVGASLYAILSAVRTDAPYGLSPGGSGGCVAATNQWDAARCNRRWDTALWRPGPFRAPTDALPGRHRRGGVSFSRLCRIACSSCEKVSY